MIEFQYFSGCPNSDETLENLKQLVDEGYIEEDEVRITEVANPEEAERLSFQGSPTILVDGIDVYTGRKPVSFSFSCRTYTLDGERTGVLDKNFIRGKLVDIRRHGQ